MRTCFGSDRAAQRLWAFSYTVPGTPRCPRISPSILSPELPVPGTPLVERYAEHGIRHRVHGHYLIFYRVEPTASPCSMCYMARWIMRQSCFRRGWEQFSRNSASFSLVDNDLLAVTQARTSGRLTPCKLILLTHGLTTFLTGSRMLPILFIIFRVSMWRAPSQANSDPR